MYCLCLSGEPRSSSHSKKGTLSTAHPRARRKRVFSAVCPNSRYGRFDVKWDGPSTSIAIGLLGPPPPDDDGNVLRALVLVLHPHRQQQDDRRIVDSA